MSEITHAYVGDLIAKRGEDGFLRVKGIATDATLDLDEQICDPEWLKTAMPKWMEVGNVREMHQSKAVGKATEMSTKGSGYAVEAKIVDKDAAMKVEEGIYTGFSIGIKGARVVKDASAPGGRIISGTIVELSLVDRPANPSAVIEIAKSVDGELVKGSAVTDVEKEISQDMVQVEQPFAVDLAIYAGHQVCNSCFGTGAKTNTPYGEHVDCEVCLGSGVEPSGRSENIEQNSPSIQTAFDNRDIKGTEAEVEKKDYTDAQRADMAESGQAMSNGGFPIKTVKDLKNAIRSVGRAKDRAAAIAHIIARAKALGKEDLIPDSFKAVDAEVEKGGPGSGPHPGDGKPSFGSAHLADGKLDFTNQQKIDNAIQMYGRDSKQHLEAIRRFGGKKSADAVTTTADFKSALQEFEAVRPDSFKAVEHDTATLDQVRAGLIALMKAELDEMLAGTEDEIGDVQELLCSLQMFMNWWDGESDEGETVAPYTETESNETPEGDDYMAYVGLGVSADLIKSASATDATDSVRDELRSEIVKALGLETEIATYKAALTKQEEDINVLKAALDEVREMAAPGGPVLRQTGAQSNKTAQVTALQVEAERRRLLASQITDPDLRNQYLDAARRLDAQASQF